MRIRSVTLSTDISYPLDLDDFAAFESFQERARARFAEVDLEVQTVRLATQPFPGILESEGPAAAPSLAQSLEKACVEHGIDYCSVGPVSAVSPKSDLSFIEAIPGVICATEAVFASVLVAEQGAGINLDAISRSAGVIADVAQSTPSGFGNLRLAVLANCGPGSPFFPVSYHQGGRTRFAVATEAADLAVKAFDDAGDLAEAHRRLRSAIEEDAERIERVAEELETAFGYGFGGIDFSLAPFPETERSIGHAMEKLGLDGFGASGTLFAVAFVKRAIEAAGFEQCGFSGVMLPVLEDQTLAERTVDGTYTLDSLLLYSTVCGTGLDTIPLPGDVTVEELAAILLDVATLSLVAEKPLTARLMPIPGLEAGELTEFDFEYFANGRVMATRGLGASRVFKRGGFWRL